MANQLTSAQEEKLQGLLQQIKDNPPAPGSVPSFSELWPFLSASEAQLIALMAVPQVPPLPPITAPGDPELGLWLFTLNNLQTGTFTQKCVYDLLSLLGMPQSAITATMYSAYITRLDNGAGVVAGDGTYMSNITYGAFDDGWDTASYTYMLLLFNEVLNDLPSLPTFWQDVLDIIEFLLPSITPFVTSTTPPIQIPSSSSPLTIAVFGDWGTGQPAAQQVLSAMQSLNPNIYMHLGDVYYAGLSPEETSNLLKPLNSMTNVPKGTMFFTLNSNHEMYDGATGYFGTALASPLFSTQGGASYFALEFENWVLLGLDSAYFDTQSLSNLDAFMNGALLSPGTTTNPQAAFVSGLNLTGKQVIVFTHHNGLNVDGSVVNQPLLGQLNTILGQYPDFWYYGHIHDGVVYTNPPVLSGLQTPANNPLALRCCGHAALPYGAPYWLSNPSTPSYIPYFAQTNAGNSNIQMSNTIRNGFALLTLSQGQIVETFYEVDINTGAPVQMWTNTTNF